MRNSDLGIQGNGPKPEFGTGLFMPTYIRRMDDPRTLTADLVRRLAATLDDDPAFERHGDVETSPWGSGQWMKYTDPDGRVRYLRVVVEPYRPD
jgi:hypothetical protein